LKLETESHFQSYTVDWIKKYPSIKLTNLCHVPISVGKLYQDFVTCEVVNIDKYLLGRLWQHDVDATHRDKNNNYMFTWKGKRVA